MRRAVLVCRIDDSVLHHAPDNTVTLQRLPVPQPVAPDGLLRLLERLVLLDDPLVKIGRCGVEHGGFSLYFLPVVEQ